MPEVVYLREFPGAHQNDRGHAIAMTMPLHPMIRKRWIEGELHRVTEDGKPWPDGNVLPGEEPDQDEDEQIAERDGEYGDEEPPESPESPEPQRPHGNARKEVWLAYAVSLGAVGEDEGQEMTQAELRKLVTPDEE